MIRTFQHTLQLITATLLLFVSLCGYAEPPVKITMLLSGESHLYYNAVDGVKEELDKTPGADYDITTVTDINDIDINKINSNSDYFIAVGSKALRYISATEISIPVLNILVSRRNYQAISKKSLLAKNSSVIYLDQPAERLLLLAKFVLDKRARKIGMLFGPASSDEKNDYMHAANQLSLELVAQVEKSEKASLDVIESLIKSSDAYIALYDRKVLNRKTAKWLLYMANVYRKPVIAYSKSYVEAGAIAAVYTTPADAGRSAASWVAENTRSSKTVLWKRYPQRFSVDVNRRIATKLNLSIDDSDVISSKIKNAEVKK